MLVEVGIIYALTVVFIIPVILASKVHHDTGIKIPQSFLMRSPAYLHSMMVMLIFMPFLCVMDIAIEVFVSNLYMLGNHRYASHFGGFIMCVIVYGIMTGLTLTLAISGYAEAIKNIGDFVRHVHSHYGEFFDAGGSFEQEMNSMEWRQYNNNVEWVQFMVRKGPVVMELRCPLCPPSPQPDNVLSY